MRHLYCVLVAFLVFLVFWSLYMWHKAHKHRFVSYCDDYQINFQTVVDSLLSQQMRANHPTPPLTRQQKSLLRQPGWKLVPQENKIGCRYQYVDGDQTWFLYWDVEKQAFVMICEPTSSISL